MPKKTGIVIEALPALRFRVEFEDGEIMMTYLAGKLYKNFIKVLVGDKVDVEIPSTGNIGRIVKRR